MGIVRAWLVRQLGGPEGLTLETFEPPPPAPGLVRIAVAAAAVSFFRLTADRRLVPGEAGLPFVPGMEVTGTVVAAPADSGFRTR
jgi:NADPH2:quinone reductase